MLVHPVLRLCLAISLMTVEVAAASDYTCGSDPGFCFFDRSNDGCYDPGLADVGPIDDALEQGQWPAAGQPLERGAIVCPPSVESLEVTPISSSSRWETRWGGVIIHRAMVHLASVHVIDPLVVVSGDDVFLGGRVIGENGTSLAIGGRDIRIAADITFLGEVGGFSAESGGGGSIVVGPHVRIRAGSVGLSTFESGAAISLLEGVRISQFRRDPPFNGVVIIAGTDIDVAAPVISAKGGITLHAEGQVRATGRMDLRKRRVRPPVDYATTIFGRLGVSIEQLTTRGARDILISGRTTAIGSDAGPVSRISAVDPESSTITIRGAESIDVRRAKLEARTIGFFSTAGPVSITNSTLRNRGTLPGVFDIDMDVPDVCDLSGSSTSGLTFTHDCASVIGP
jgi:hypothetical protein